MITLKYVHESHFNINSDDEAHLDQHGFDLNYVRADHTRITLLDKSNGKKRHCALFCFLRKDVTLEKQKE